MGSVLDLPDLPTDLFLIIISYLHPIDTVRCRLVSKLWHREFTDESFLRHVLVSEYGEEAQDVDSLLDFEVEHLKKRLSRDDFGQIREILRNGFDRVLARKTAIRSGKPRSVTKRNLRGGLTDLLTAQADVRDRHLPVTPWSRYHSSLTPRRSYHATELQMGQVPTDLSETVWTYDCGLLVYPDEIELQAYLLLDIEQDTISTVPFDTKDRIVRRIRLKDNLLVLEWAEKEPYHKLNEFEEVHRHYVTVFDVKAAKDSFPWLNQWEITLRYEWKLHYLGFPLSAQDCWFSDHSATHYAVYTWQTNRSAWGENEPIESLLVWDMSQPSGHHPSSDPSHGSQITVAPRLVKKLSYLDLDFLTIRQRDTPFLRKIALDGSACVYFFEEGCNREIGSHVGHGHESGRRNPRDVVWERIVGVPILGPGPRWEDRMGKDSTFAHKWQPADLSREPSKRATCWRYAGMGSGMRNQIVRDYWADISYIVVQRCIGCPEIWVSSNSGKWCTEIDMQGIQWRWTQINGDEHYLIMQSGEELHILHFDVDLRAMK